MLCGWVGSGAGAEPVLLGSPTERDEAEDELAVVPV